MCGVDLFFDEKRSCHAGRKTHYQLWYIHTIEHNEWVWNANTKQTHTRLCVWGSCVWGVNFLFVGYLLLTPLTTVATLRI